MTDAEYPGGLAEQAERLADGRATSVELVGAALDRIAGAQPSLGAFRRIREADALVEAKEADRRIAASERAPLLGVPVAIKDDVDLAGLPTAFGCPGDFPDATDDSAVVTRLKSAGAVIVGKTNSSELGQWPHSEGSFGAARNPWNLDHTPGGSSGGSAAAVAARLVPAAVGSDGAGSVRIPAAWTNLVGIKTQRGLIDPAPETEPFNGLTVYGPLARTVGDAALLLDVLADSGERFQRAARRGPGWLRVGISAKLPYTATPTALDDEVRAGLIRIAAAIRRLGHQLVQVRPRYGLLTGATFLPRSLSGVHEWTRRVPDARLLDPRTRSNARFGRLLGGPALAAARSAETLLHKRIGAIFRDVDVMIVPTTATPPPRIGSFDGLTGWDTDKAMTAACPYSWPWNILGWPGVNVPAGHTRSGLPVGVQLLGRESSEEMLISLAAQLESAQRWADERPPGFD